MATQIVNGLVTNAAEFDFTEAPSTWAGYTSWDGFGDTIGGTGISTTLTFLSDAVDLGAVINVVPVVTCTTNTTTAHVISFQTSNDNVSYSAASTGPLTARYIKTQVVVTNTSARPGFTLLRAEFIKDTISESFIGLDTSTLAGATSARQIPITKSYSKVLQVTGSRTDDAGSNDAPITVQPHEKDSSGGPTIFCMDLDTWGKTNIDAVIDVTVVGLPGVTVTSSGDVELS